VQLRPYERGQSQSCKLWAVSCDVHMRVQLASICALRSNPSLKLTRYGRRCKTGPRHRVHHREPGLQRLPPRAA
jgi:hypothetical protein